MISNDRIKAIEFKRKIIGLSRQNLADMCCLTKQTISNVILGKSVSESTVLLIEYKLAEYFRTWSPYEMTSDDSDETED